MTDKRLKELFSRTLDWVAYHCPDEKELYRALTDPIGMTDDEIKELGIEALDGYLAKRRRRG